MSRCSDTPEPLPQCLEKFDHLIEAVDAVRAQVCGNGKPGLDVRVDRLEQIESGRANLKRSATAALFMVAATNLVALVYLVLRLWAHGK